MTETTGLLAIKTALKALLKTSTLSRVSIWLSAEPPATAYPCLIFGWVEWAGGVKTREAADTKKPLDAFYIVILVQNPNADKAEDTAMELLEAAETVLEASPTVSGTCTDSAVVRREKQKVFADKNSIVAVRLTLETWRWV